MNKKWKHEFRSHMTDLKNYVQKGDYPLSIKIQIASGCCERRCSPNAWNIIDNYILKNGSQINNAQLIEHESGPEILLGLAIKTAYITLAKSILDLINTIIKAIYEGSKKGDKAKGPIDIVIRRVINDGEYKEEITYSIKQDEYIEQDKFDNILKKAIKKIFK